MAQLYILLKFESIKKKQKKVSVSGINKIYYNQDVVRYFSNFRGVRKKMAID